MRAAILLVLVFLWLPATALAVLPDEKLDDPELEARAQALSSDIRCVVCQNESIETSNAGIARDIRMLIRERLVAGQDEEQIRDYLVSRYGDYILFLPPMKPSTWLLWFGPGLILAIGLLTLVIYLRKHRLREEESHLSKEEQRRLQQLMEEEPRS